MILTSHMTYKMEGEIRSMFVFIFGLLVAAEVGARGPLRHQFPKGDIHCDHSHGEDPGQPLFLTKYVESGDIKTGQKLSRVGSLKGLEQESYAGLFTVNKQFNSNMFFWFFPAQENPETAPVVLWLQGGPGGSSLFGLFVENGPVGVSYDLHFFKRKINWNSKYSMLYIDNPVGTGFSFTDSADGYSRNETAVAENLFIALTQFFLLFPQYQKNDFYATGESYAGKYVPAIAYRILKEKRVGGTIINLQGIAVGDGFSDPPGMIAAYSNFLFNIGMLDERQTAYFKSQTDLSLKLISQGQYTKAFKLWDELLNGDTTGHPSFFTNVTGSTDYYNYMRSRAPSAFEYYGKVLARANVRKAIHVGNLTYNSGDKVEAALENDIFQSVKPWLAEVMNNYKVLIYSGQLDIIVALPLTEAMLQTTPWKYLDLYKKADRSVWYVNPEDTEVAGYVRNVKDFYQVMIRGAGHIAPYDQPQRSFDMIERFISGRGF